MSRMSDEGAPASSLRYRLNVMLDPTRRTGRGLSMVNRVVVGSILVAGALAIVETEPSLADRFGQVFLVMELVLGGLFSLEYLARLWVAPEQRAGVAPWRARLAFVVSPAGLTDLIAIASSLLVASGSSALLLRIVRVGRILRLAKLGRMSRALNHMIAAVGARREELMLSLVGGMVLMVIAATALYLAEGHVQPDKFGSIPRALWWSVATLTTIGYGDVYPVTPLGKILAALTAIFSIGLIAMPTGILAAAFSDGLQRHRRVVDETTPDATPEPPR
ncbi:MAG: ion transporter [Pseudomonadota bacterium]